MFQKKIKPDQVDTVIGAGSKFEGKVIATGLVRVDGSLRGDIDTQGNVVIGEKGSVEGNVNGLHITLAGFVQGRIHAKGSLHLLSTAKVGGDMEVVKLVVEEGSQFNGKCNMTDGKGNKVETGMNETEKAG